MLLAQWDRELIGQADGFNPLVAERNIVWEELFAIAAVANTCGHLWACKKVLFHCDNQAVVDIWKTGTTKSSDIMALVRMLYFCA